MPDNFHAYRSNLAPGCSDRDVEQYYEGGGDDVEDGEEDIMNDMLRVDVADGKYTVVQDHTGRLKALRYGEPWRDCCGDGLILALAHELEEAQARQNKLERALTETSIFWQSVALHYGQDHLCRDAEAKALAIRDEALAVIIPTTTTETKTNMNEQEQTK